MADRSFLDWPFFDDEHRTLAHDLDGWVAEHISSMPEAREETADEACRELVERLARTGWLDYAVPGEDVLGEIDLAAPAVRTRPSTYARCACCAKP